MQYQYNPNPPDTSGISQPSVLARKRVRNELRGKWLQDDDFFHKFFPLNDHVRKISSRAKSTLYLDSEGKQRWKGIPRDSKSLGSRLYTALNDLLNDILHCSTPDFSIYNPRLFLKTYRRKVLPDITKPIWPGILLAGGGRSFLEATSIRPVADYRSGISPFEVVLDNTDEGVSRERLATMVQEMFNHQLNRRFAFGMVISPNTLRCYLFDHSGIVFSPVLDYHADPDQFCALIAGMTSPDETRLGWDTSMFGDETNRAVVRTRDFTRNNRSREVLYVIYSSLYHAPSLLGRGTTCLLAHRSDDAKTRYVIKDAWISTDDPELEGKESEASLLLLAKSRGVTQGIAQLCHWEDVRLKGRNGKFMIDSIHNNRQLKASEAWGVRQRMHTRIVLATYGKPLEEFSSRKELLLAFYDAVRAHRKLYEKARILHRDIKPGNILINCDGEEGERGVLIDLDHAIRTDNTSPYSMRKHIGTYLFMSSNVIQGDAPHDYMDDLESFYYVLVYIVTLYEGPRSPKRDLPSVLEAWQGDAAWSAKEGHFLRGRVSYDIQPWFGDSFRTLMGRIHSLFGQRLTARLLALRVGKTPPPVDPVADSDAFLSHLCQAIIDLEEETKTSNHVDHRRTSSTTAGFNHGRKDLVSRAPKSNHSGDLSTLASSRSLRRYVNYGRHKWP